jgi:hypothetical protein
VVHEGDEPALYAVLSGRLDVIKRIDGIERKIGERPAGSLMGEVPIIYGTPFQSAARAVEPTRLARIEPRQFHAAAALSADLARRMGELARERIGGLQGIPASARRAKVTLVGERWSPECLAIRPRCYLPTTRDRVAIPDRTGEKQSQHQGGAQLRSRRHAWRAASRSDRYRRQDGGHVPEGNQRRPLRLHRRGCRNALAAARGGPR